MQILSIKISHLWVIKLMLNFFMATQDFFRSERWLMTSLRFRQIFTVSPGDRKVQIKVWIRCVRRDLNRTKAGQCDNGQPQPIVWADCYDLWSDSWRHVNPKKHQTEQKIQTSEPYDFSFLPSKSFQTWMTDFLMWTTKICFLYDECKWGLKLVSFKNL